MVMMNCMRMMNYFIDDSVYDYVYNTEINIFDNKYLLRGVGMDVRGSKVNYSFHHVRFIKYMLVIVEKWVIK